MRKIVALVMAVFCLACSNTSETTAEKESLSSSLYHDYQIWAAEGEENVTIKLQYRTEKGDGPAILLNQPSRVLLDGEALLADSTKFAGVYYEVSKPLAGFAGRHILVFTDRNNNVHREEFTFVPFSLAKELREHQKKQAFQIRLKDFPAEPTAIRLVITDTSYASDDVNEELLVEDGIISITEEQLQNIKKGPVALEIYREEEREVGTPSKSIGKFKMIYSLKRDFTFIE